MRIKIDFDNKTIEVENATIAELIEFAGKNSALDYEIVPKKVKETYWPDTPFKPFKFPDVPQNPYYVNPVIICSTSESPNEYTITSRNPSVAEISI